MNSYPLAENDYICKSLMNSKTISVSKKIQKYFFAELINSKNNNVRMKLQTLQILQIFIECRIMVGGAIVRISKHFTLKLSRSRSVVDCALCGVVWYVWCEGVVCTCM